MNDIAVGGALVVAGVGLVMVVAACIALTTKRMLGLSEETVNDPWYRRSDTSGLSWAIHWLRPGLVLLVVGGVATLALSAA